MVQINFFSCCLIFIIVHTITDVQSEKSLFDDLPLNGAYSVDGPGEVLELDSIITQRNDEEDKSSSPQKQSSDEEKSMEDKEYIISSTSVNSSENSLFDSLPNQGAMTSDPNNPAYIFDSKTQKRGIFTTNTNAFRSPNGHLTFQLELEKQPVTEISVKSKTSSDVQKLYTVLSPPALPPIQGLQISLQNIPSAHRQNGLYQTPSQNHQTSNRQNGYQPPAQNQQSGNPPSGLYQTPAQNQQSGNPPSGLYQTPVQNQQPNNPPTRLYQPPSQNYQSVNRPNMLYQTPSRNQFPPIGVMHREEIPRVSTIYGKPNRNLKPNSGPNKYFRINYYNNFRSFGRKLHHNNQDQRENEAPTEQSMTTFPVIGPTTSMPPVSAGYGPSVGYSSSPSGGYNYPSPSGGYESSPSETTTITSITSTEATTPPSIMSTIRPNSGSHADYDYDSLTDAKGSGGGIIDRRVFGARTGFYRTNFNVPSASYTPPQENYQRDSYPSNSYGPPTQEYGPPSQQYGPPATSEAPTAPTLAPTSPPVQSDTPASSSATTSISYQTIPVQTIQTQLITVPQITVSSTSPVESESGIDDGFGRPQSPTRPQSPSSAYGAPGATQSFGRQATRGSSGPLFTDEQLALLISASRGTVGTNLFEDDSISGITGGRGINSNFADIFGGGSRLVGGSPLLQPNIQQLPTRGINGLFQTQSPFVLQQNRFQGIQASNANRAVLTGDAVATISDIIREQRLRDAVTDLRGKLRQETRSAERNQQNYRSLFYKGALLLGALSLLPTVATPLAAAAGVTPSFLLPLAGRRKREAKLPFILSMENVQNYANSSSIDHNAFGLKDPKLGFMRRALPEAELLFNNMHLKGAVLPQDIRATLRKYLSPQDIIRNSGCVQKRFCETLVQIQSLPNAETFLFLYAIFANDVETNPWIREAMVAARSRKCDVFYCFQPYSQSQQTKLPHT